MQSGRLVGQKISKTKYKLAAVRIRIVRQSTPLERCLFGALDDRHLCRYHWLSQAHPIRGKLRKKLVGYVQHYNTITFRLGIFSIVVASKAFAS